MEYTDNMEINNIEVCTLKNYPDLIIFSHDAEVKVKLQSSSGLGVHVFCEYGSYNTMFYCGELYKFI